LKIQTQILRIDRIHQDYFLFRYSSFVIRHSFGFLVSDFGFS